MPEREEYGSQGGDPSAAKGAALDKGGCRLAAGVGCSLLIAAGDETELLPLPLLGLPGLQIAVYSGAGLTPAELCAHAEERFNLRLAPTFEVMPLRLRALLAPERYPRLTMVRQALGSVRVALEGLRQVVPEVYVDTTGWAFPYPLAAAAGARVAAYVHYPTISTDMLDRVARREAGYANGGDVAGSGALSALKLAYYHAFAAVYGLAGGFASVRRGRGGGGSGGGGGCVHWWWWWWSEAAPGNHGGELQAGEQPFPNPLLRLPPPLLAARWSW